MNEVAPKNPSEEMLRFAISGASFPEITKRMAEFGYTQEQIANGADAVFTYFKAMAEFNPDVEKGRAFARLNMLFMASIKIQDYKTSLSVQKEVNKLLGLYANKNAATEEAGAMQAIRAIIEA